MAGHLEQAIVWHAYFIEDVLLRIGQLGFERIGAQLWKVDEALNDWLYALFERPYSGWQDAFDDFVEEQAAEGREISPESKQALVEFIEEHFAKTQSESEIFGALGRYGAHPQNQDLSYSLPPDSELTDEDLMLAHDIAMIIHQLRQAIREAKAALDKPSVLSQLNPFGEERLSILQRLAEMKAAMSELELIFTLLGYDAIAWSRFDFPSYAGLEGALSHVPYAGTPHAIHNVTIGDLSSVWAAGGLAKLAASVTSRGIVAIAGATAKSRTVAIREEATLLLQRVTTEEYNRLSKNLSRVGDHLSARELAASINPAIARANFGKAIEKAVAKRIRDSPKLSKKFQFVGTRRPSHDISGIGRFEGLVFDITTTNPRTIAEHLSREYGDDLIIIQYPPPTLP